MNVVWQRGYCNIAVHYYTASKWTLCFTDTFYSQISFIQLFNGPTMWHLLDRWSLITGEMHSVKNVLMGWWSLNTTSLHVKSNCMFVSWICIGYCYVKYCLITHGVFTPCVCKTSNSSHDCISANQPQGLQSAINVTAVFWWFYVSLWAHYISWTNPKSTVHHKTIGWAQPLAAEGITQVISKGRLPIMEVVNYNRVLLNLMLMTLFTHNHNNKKMEIPSSLKVFNMHTGCGCCFLYKALCGLMKDSGFLPCIFSSKYLSRAYNSMIFFSSAKKRCQISKRNIILQENFWLHVLLKLFGRYEHDRIYICVQITHLIVWHTWFYYRWLHCTWITLRLWSPLKYLRIYTGV